MGRDYTQTLPAERLGPSDVDIWGDGGAPGTEKCSEPNVCVSKALKSGKGDGAVKGGAVK